MAESALRGALFAIRIRRSVDTGCPKTVSEITATSPYIQNTVLSAAQIQQALGKYVS